VRVEEAGLAGGVDGGQLPAQLGLVDVEDADPA